MATFKELYTQVLGDIDSEVDLEVAERMFREKIRVNKKLGTLNTGDLKDLLRECVEAAKNKEYYKEQEAYTQFIRTSELNSRAYSIAPDPDRDGRSSNDRRKKK